MTDELETFEHEVPGLYDDRLAALRELIPEAFADGELEAGALVRAVGFKTDEEDEGFGLTWPGKAAAARAIQAPSTGALVPDPEESVAWDTTENVIVEGDNLEVLKLLQRAYFGSVKLVYIDPPYNTGKEFIYPDNFREGLAEYLKYSGQVDDDGVARSAKSEASGRVHSRWLSMMYPRLVLARNLLRQDGILMASIDDHEVHHLRMLLNEVFGEENFVATMVWQGGRKNDSKLVSSGHDYIIVFARDLSHLKELDVRWEEAKQGLAPIYKVGTKIWAEHAADPDEAHTQLLAWYRELPEGHPSLEHDHYSFLDEDGIFYKDNISSPNYRENLIYDFRGYSPPSNGWRYEVSTMERLLAENRIHLPPDKSKRIQVKRYLHETETWAPNSVFYRDRRGARKVVEELLGVNAKGLFDFPKDHGVLARLIGATTSDDDLVLDFFAGSGSTAHAVMHQNSIDGGRRRFLLVQLPEEVDHDTYGDIAQITRARVRAAGHEYDAEAVDTGFRSYRLAASVFQEWSATSESDLPTALSLFAESAGSEATASLIAAELVLKSGFGLAEPVAEEIVGGVTVHAVADAQLLIVSEGTLSVEVVEELIDREPALLLVLDRCFADDDELKVNAVQTVRAANQGSGPSVALKVV